MATVWTIYHQLGLFDLHNNRSKDVWPFNNKIKICPAAAVGRDKPPALCCLKVKCLFANMPQFNAVQGAQLD